MSFTGPPDSSALIYSLCSRITGRTDGSISSYYQLAVTTLSSIPSSSNCDEFVIVENIKKELVREKREKDAIIFMELHQKLRSSPLLRNRVAVLQLLSCLGGVKPKNQSTISFRSHITKLKHLSPVVSRKITNGEAYKARLYGGSIVNYEESILKVCPDFSTLPSLNAQTAGESIIKKHVNNSNKNTTGESHKVARITAMFVNSGKQDSTESSPTKRDSSVSPRQKQHIFKFDGLPTIDVSEKDLLQELLFVFQGIEGRIIKRDSVKGTYFVDSKLRISAPVKELVMRFTQLGRLYTQVRNFCEKKSQDKLYGLVGQSFVSAVQEQLTEFYRLIAVLESQLHQDTSVETNGMTNGLTLRRLLVWCMDPLVRMKFLASLVDACSEQKGGALASVVYSFLLHGDPMVQELVNHILLSVSQPIMKMLKEWMLRGELEDCYLEFFVALSTTSHENSNLWYEKYYLRKPMVPKFLSMEEAQKILSTGKAINFLREVCKHNTDFKGASWIKAEASSSAVYSLFTADKDGEFQALLTKTYKDISKHMLSVLHTEFHFMDHLQAMRSFLLLGQGDFIRHLMDQLEPELYKPANQLQLHTLSGILDCAVRSTNAQFYKAEILDRLDVRLETHSEGDTGWDVFSLNYHMTGPISTVFTSLCHKMYMMLFRSLFQAKRIEYLLSNMWIKQMSFSQLLRSVQEAQPVLHQFQLLLSEMVHFVQQIQYYIAFEVMECCWADLQNKVKDAVDLDQIIAAHEEFLDTITKQALLREESEEFLHRLRLIYDIIVNVQEIQESFWDNASAEIQARAQRVMAMEKKTEEGKWGTSAAEIEIHEQRQKEFVQVTIPRVASDLRLKANCYHESVHQFLQMLMESDDQNLRFLSFRLDFNEFYKKQNTNLQTSLTYFHRRKSMARFC